MHKDFKRISWDHTIETYQGNKKPGRDWFLIGSTIFLLLFGLLIIYTVYGH